MKTATRCFWTIALFLLGTTTTMMGQPVVSITLSGTPQNSADANHPYENFSASLGANLRLHAAFTGAPVTRYEWQFNEVTLSNQTTATLTLTNVQTASAGSYTAIVYTATNAVSNQVVLSIDPTFTKITTGGIVTTVDYNIVGGTWADYDQDGYLDLLVYHGAAAVPTLYHNNGNGTFSPVSVGINASADGAGACWGDYDNDGFPDLYVTTQSAPSQLYHNNGKGAFTRATTAGRIVQDIANSGGAAWADFDNDGFIDMFVPVFDENANSHCYFYRNNGDGTFTSITNGPEVTDIGSAVGVSWADYDNDGNIDLFVAGGRGDGEPAAPNRLYHNNGDGTFTRITNGAIVTDVGHAGLSAWGDYDNDGYLDLFVQNIQNSTNFLYHNNGDGTFTRITNSVVAQDVANRGGSIGCAWGDYDNDGFLDLFVSNYSSDSTPPTVNFLYHNNGDGTFSKVTVGSIVNEFSDTVGCAWVDYDNDGFLDLFVASGHGQGNFLYHNNRNSNGWLTVRLRGTVSNASAIGAKVRIKAHYRGADRWQLRQITGGSGWDGFNEVQANFGLGDATNVDTLRIEWPSGIVQEFHNIAPKQILNYVEPPRLSAIFTNGAPQFALKGGRNLSYEIDSSADLKSWKTVSQFAITNMSGVTNIVDTNSPAGSQLFYRAVMR